jgi:hydroxyacylglutathione hydrolase
MDKVYNMSYEISSIKAFSDNYIWALHNQKHALVVDPGDAAPVLAFLAEKQLMLATILITHHHFDHTGGIAALTEAFPELIVYGPDNSKIEGITNTLSENDHINLPELDLSFNILETPGHTLDHIVYVHPNFIFCGDTLFSGGCGRMFEGTPEVFYSSLQKLAVLPGETKVYCTHEYTQANMAFALSVDNKNAAVIDYANWVNEKRKHNEITLPSTIKRECEINPFLRCHNSSIRKMLIETNAINAMNPSEVETFAALRALKDNF